MTDQAATQSGDAQADARPVDLASAFDNHLGGGQPKGQAQTEQREAVAAEPGETPDNVDGQEAEEQVVEKFRVPALEGDGFEELTADEIKARMLMQSDYTRKTQATAEERKAFAAEKQKSQQVMAERMQAIEQQAQLLANAIQSFESQVNWDALRASDPSAFLEAKEQQGKRLQAFRQTMEMQKQMQAAQRAEALEASRQRLYEAKPELLDPSKAKAFSERVLATASEFGFTPDDVAAVTDHRLLMLVDAAAELKSIKEKASAIKPVMAKAPQMSQPGATKPGNPAALQTYRTIEKAKQTKSLGDMADAFTAVLNQKR